MVKAVYSVDAVRHSLIPLPEKGPSGHKKVAQFTIKNCLLVIFSRPLTKVRHKDTFRKVFGLGHKTGSSLKWTVLSKTVLSQSGQSRNQKVYSIPTHDRPFRLKNPSTYRPRQSTFARPSILRVVQLKDRPLSLFLTVHFSDLTQKINSISL